MSRKVTSPEIADHTPDLARAEQLVLDLMAIPAKSGEEAVRATRRSVCHHWLQSRRRTERDRRPRPRGDKQQRAEQG